MIWPDPKRRYEKLIAATLRSGLASWDARRAAAPGTLNVEVALPSIALKLGIGFAEPARETITGDLAEAPDDALFADGFGHRRPMYRCLALRALASDETAGRFIRRFLADAQSLVVRFVRGDVVIAAANGSAVAACVFHAWAALSLPGTSDDLRDASAAVFVRLVAQQQPDGTFLQRTQSDNPEPVWYEELAILHALWTYAGTLPEGELKSTMITSACRAAAYHAAEVQPDHASSHPWAIAAFLAIPEGVQLADMMLHAAGVQQPSAMDAVSLLLLADAVDTSA
jgi:hypothetical protein